MAYCVSIKSKEFISLCKDLNISSGDLSLIIYQYLNTLDTDEFPSKDYILSKLLGASTKMSDALILVYNNYYSTSKVFDTKQELDKERTKALLFFEPEALFSYKTNDGKYVLNIGTPDFTEEYNRILKNAPRDSLGRLLAPNGKPSNLNERLYALVRTKAFKEWFGDWENNPEEASKVVDENGEPLVVYHGTSRKLNNNSFKTEFIFASDNDIIAAGYSFQRKGFSIGIDYALSNFSGEDIESFRRHIDYLIKALEDEIEMGENTPFYQEGDLDNNKNLLKELQKAKQEIKDIDIFKEIEYNVFDIFQNVKNPLVIDAKNEYWHSIEFEGTITNTNELAKIAKDRGYDGLVIKNVIDKGAEASKNGEFADTANDYIAFNPNQIKSAESNVGTFSKTNNRIDRFTLQLNATFDYLKSLDIPIRNNFSGSDLTKVFNEFKTTLAKIIETNLKLHHYDLGTIEQPSNRLEDVKDELAYYEYLLNLTNNIIKKLESLGKTVEIIANNNLNSPMGIDSSSNVIKLYYNPNLLLRGFSKFDYILAHELIHSVTSNAINNTTDNTATNEELLFSKDIWDIIVDLYNNKKFHWDFGFNLSDREGRASHIKEFIANVMTNPRLLSRLALIKVDNKNKSLLDRFISAIKNLLNKYLGIDIRDSYLEKLMNTTSLYIENQKINIGRNMTDSFKEGSATRFTTSKSSNYRERTKENAEWSDVTLALAKDFNTAGEKLTKNVAGKKYVPYKLEGAGEHSYDADEILEAIKAKGLPTKNIKLNIAGNGIYSLKNWTQEELNDYLTEILQGLLNLGVTIAEVRTGGQTGVDEAGIIAAQRLGIPNEVHTTSDYKFRDKSGKDISDEKAFKARFQQNTVIEREIGWARTAKNGYEVSTKGDKRFSALVATFNKGTIIDGVDVGGKTIEDVYQSVIKKSRKGQAPSKDSKLYNESLKTKEEREDFSYKVGYLPLWQEWAKQNPQLIEELRIKAQGKTLTDQFANTRVSQARALSDILNSTNTQQGQVSQEEHPIVEIYNGEWTRNEVAKDTESLYIFTDNTDRDSGKTLINPNSKYAKKYGKDKHYPTMTQAVIRGLDNAMPISTQRWYHQGAKGISGRWTDKDIKEFEKVIDLEIEDILEEWNTGKYKRIVIANADGFFNTKISNISMDRTPLLYKMLEEKLTKAGIIRNIQEEQVEVTSELLEARDIVDTIKEDSNLHIRRDNKTHIYYIDGRPADTSVTKLIHGEVNLGGWEIPSTSIGNSLDLAARLFFRNGTIIGEKIPNMTKEQIANLNDDLIKLRESLDRKFGGKLGEAYEVVTEEILLAGKYNYLDSKGRPATLTVGGTMDMLVYDNKGNFYIYDFKTKRTQDASKPSEFNSETAEGYYKQLSMYKAILEANYPQLKGKIKELNLIRFDTYYPTPLGENSGEVTYNKYGDNLYYTEDDSTPTPIQNNKSYKAPRLSIITENGIIVAPEQTFEGEYKSYKDLEDDERAIIEEEVGEATVEKPVEQSSLDRQISDLYNPGIMSATERQFLANTAMYYTSYIITHLQTNRKANKKYFGDAYKVYDFTTMSRRDIIDTIGIENILNYVKETYFNSESELREDIEDLELLNKLNIAYDNWGALILGAYSKLISLEDTTVINTRPDEITLEGLYEGAQDIVEGATLEEKEREYWQIGQRQVSARSSIMGEVKRVIERLPIKDANGDYVLDEYGYGFMTFMDSGEATNRILEWCTNCTTVEEMEEILIEMAPTNPWLNEVLKKIKDEPFRSLFFHSFRKQHTKYSIITIDRDSNGKVSYNVTIVNTKEADVAILEDVVSMYNNGLMKDIIIPLKGSLEGKGKVNIKNVTEIKNKVTSLLKSLQDAHSEGILEESTNAEYNSLINIFKMLGIPVDSKVLKEAFAKDSKKKNFNNTNIFKLLRNLNNMVDTLLDNKESTAYNPVLKGGDGNIYSNYKSIVELLSNYMFDSVESSTYENGKMYYSYCLPSYLGKLMINLKDSLGDEKKFKNFIEYEYGRYKWFKDGNIWKNEWLRQLATSKEARDKLDYKVQLSYDKVEYTELSELGYTLSLMQEYFYDTSNKGDRKLAWYRVPILANKPSSEFIRFTRYSGKHYKDDIKKGLLKVFDQEVMRIKTVLERATNPNVSKIGVKEKITYDLKEGMAPENLKEKLKNKTLTIDDFVVDGKLVFRGSGAEFKFLDALNNDILYDTELGELIVEKINGVEVDESRFIELFNEAIDSYMEEIVARQIAEWEELGLYDLNEDSEKEESSFKYISNLGKTREAVDKLLEEYIWNDMFATINIIELTAVDLAYYRNVEDFQKRYAQVHSPSMRLNTTAEVLSGSKYSINGRYSADGNERTIYLRDSISSSNIIENVRTAFDNKIANTSGIERNYLITIKSQILKAFEEINWADAQGYSCPTSYRKKTGMMGRWNEDMEEAYARIVKGDYNINDLQIVWQPFKPFVYSQVAKSSGATTMKEIKVPIQNKNSEYLLFLADALMRGDNQHNKLTAIFDFMEDSAYDGRISDKGRVIKEGTYNGVGIDTVQFESAVNSGSMGAININDLETYEEIKEALNKAVYYNADKSEISDNDMDRYNDQYVQTISFEDYGIQQEIPEHFTDHEQLMGSQIRILSVSDITPNTTININGEELTGEELVNEYQNLIAENIRESFDLLIKEFNLKGTRKERNRALSDLLIKTILKDQRYGSDLLRACSLDANGEFIIPPNDPIQSTRIQQLLNSIIKSRINKQKVKGGPVVQTSSYGLAEELHIIWDENNPGKVKYFECYIPIPSEELEKALIRPDGTLMDIDEAIEKGIMTEEMRKAIGYRIPSEDKYSMAPLYIKGFLPKAAGEVIMLPKEITLLSGSDFDIDKMYIMLKSVKYSKEYFDRKAFKEAIRATLEKQGKSKEIINNFINGNIEEDSVDTYLDKIEDGVSFGREDEEGNWKEDKKGTLIYDAYMANKQKFIKKSQAKVIEGTDSKDGRNNRIFDLQWAVLTHEDTATKLFNPGSFDVQKKTSRIINILKSTNKYSYEELSKLSLKELDKLVDTTNSRNIIFSATQVYFHKQNMTAGKLIGIFANNNTSHAFISMQDIRLHIEKDEEFMFDGVRISGTENNKLDALYGKNGSLISKTIAGFLAASVDAVKDPVLNAMNLNTFTANIAMLLARLGFDSDSIGLFLTQPIIEKVTREYFKRSNEGYVTIDEVIGEFLPEDKELVDSMMKRLSDTMFTKRDLSEGIMEGVTDSDFQISALLLFSKLSTIAQDLNQLTFLTKFNSVTNAVGPTIADTFVLKDRYDRFIEKMEGDYPPFNINALSVIDNSPILKAFYETTVGDKGASKLIFRDYFIHYNFSFQYVLNALKERIKGNLDAKTINKLVNDFVLYNLTLGDNPVINSSEKNRRKFTKDFVELYKEASKGIDNNELLNAIKIKSSSKKCPVPTLEVKTGGYSIDLQEKIKSNWADLILNPKTRQLGLDLFFYNIFRSGFGFSPKTFGHLASVDVRGMIPGYIEAIRTNTTNGSFNAEEFLYQFFRNHTQEYKLVPKLKVSNNVKVANKSNIKGENIVIFATDKWKGLETIIASKSVKGVTFSPVIRYDGKVYMNPRIFGYSVQYTETTPLGNTNNFLEYGPYGSNMKSVINNNTDEVPDTKEDTPIEPKKDTVTEVDKKNTFEGKVSKILDRVEKEAGISLGKWMDNIENEEDKPRAFKQIVAGILEELGISNKDSKAKIVQEKVREKINKYC